MADYSERIKAHGQALIIKGDIDTIEAIARRHNSHNDLFIAITEAQLNVAALLDMTRDAAPNVDAVPFLLEVVE